MALAWCHCELYLEAAMNQSAILTGSFNGEYLLEESGLEAVYEILAERFISSDSRL